ncbi:MAG: HAMP domain-containing histidine kinase [Clostridiaceae bacterium]|nr:HAMP domain-containing histidine kinase [Clostridiaceae bacterium]
MLYSYGVLQDITERKLIEAELKKARDEAEAYDKLKTEFFSNISHELRTPLNILLSSLQLLNIYIYKIDADETQSIKNYLTIMKQNCFRLLRLINNFLDMTKIDAGFYTLNEGRHDIVSIVEDITSSVVEYIKNKNIEIIFDTEVEEKYINCDDDKIERIVLNLFSNAIKFTEPGGKIEVNIYKGQEEVIISIKDTGIGIPEDKLSSIFDRFSQVDKTLARNNEGTGIGLALVKSLVEMHGGKIYVKSIYGEGTEFLIHLPENASKKIDETYSNSLNLNKQYENKQESNIEKINIEFSDIYSE